MTRSYTINPADYAEAAAFSPSGSLDHFSTTALRAARGRLRRTLAGIRRELRGEPRATKEPWYVAAVSRLDRILYERRLTTAVVDVWEERDRLVIHVIAADETLIAQWIDEEAREMFTDGFFKPGRDLKGSVLQYLRDR